MGVKILIVDDNEHIRRGLRKLIESLEREAALTPTGALATRGMIVNQLTNRLRILDHRRRHPENCRIGRDGQPKHGKHRGEEAPHNYGTSVGRNLL